MVRDLVEYFEKIQKWVSISFPLCLMYLQSHLLYK